MTGENIFVYYNLRVKNPNWEKNLSGPCADFEYYSEQIIPVLNDALIRYVGPTTLMSFVQIKVVGSETYQRSVGQLTKAQNLNTVNILCHKTNNFSLFHLKSVILKIQTA